MNLKCVANTGSFMADPFSNIRYCFTPLIAWTADLPEQQMIACTSKNTSPIMLATLKECGDAECRPTHTGAHTLELIHNVGSNIDPWLLDSFQKMAKTFLLSRVHLPFWQDWLHSEVSTLLVPEVLHTLHKLFFDHLLEWCKEVLGKDELNARYKVHHKRIGVCHFASGISKVKQMTGREHRDIQCTIVAMIVGTAPPKMVQSIHALVDFIYLAQCHVHTESLIQRMEASLAEFHMTKAAIITARAC